MGRGILCVLSGFSGAGKGTMVKHLLKHYDNYALSVSVTTRDPREGETEGVSYFFRSTTEFEHMIEEDAFLEYAQYVDHYYGTPRKYVERKLDEGKDVILEIEIQGAMKIKERFPETLLIFVVPPNMQVLKERLIERGTEKEEVIKARLLRAAEESRGMGNYDYIIINDQLEDSVKNLHAIIQSEHWRMSRNTDLTEIIQKEAQEIKYEEKYED